MAEVVREMMIDGKHTLVYDGPLTAQQIHEKFVYAQEDEVWIRGVFPCSLAGVIALDQEGALDLIYYESTGTYLNDCTYRLVGCEDNGDTMLLFIEGMAENY